MSTKVIALCNGKGGVGKSSFATNMAISLMAKKKNLVYAFDLDPQAAMEGFLIDYERKLPNLHHKSVPQSSIGSVPKMVNDLSGVATHVILDVAGGDIISVQSIIPLTNWMIIPSRPSKKDFASTTSLLITLTDKGYFDANPSLKAAIVLNQCSYHPQNTLAQEMVDAYNEVIEDGGLQDRIQVFNTRITIATAWIEADMRCEAISETKSKAAKQWDHFIKELTKKGGL